VKEGIYDYEERLEPETFTCFNYIIESLRALYGDHAFASFEVAVRDVVS